MFRLCHHYPFPIACVPGLSVNAWGDPREQNTVASEALALQVLSIDGITIDASLAADLPALQAQLGRKADLFPCPALSGAARHPEAVCTRHVRMMPSSRIAVRVLNDQAGARTAVLRTADFPTGPTPDAADDWPAIDLAAVNFAAPAAHVAALVLPRGGGVRPALAPSGVLGAPPSVRAPGAQRPEPLDDVQRRTV